MADVTRRPGPGGDPMQRNPEFDEANGEQRKKLYREGADLVSGID